MIAFYSFIDFFKKSDSIIIFVWILSTTLAFSVITVIIYLKYLRSTLRRNEKSKTKLEKQFETAVINYLYSGDHDSQEISSAQQLIIEELKKKKKNHIERTS